jgi:hypothetical protein
VRGANMRAGGKGRNGSGINGRCNHGNVKETDGKSNFVLDGGDRQEGILKNKHSSSPEQQAFLFFFFKFK